MFSTFIKKMIFCPIGAFIIWMLASFKGQFKDYNKEQNEDNNFWTGIIFSGLVFTLIQILKGTFK